jgi:osmoprotectant transport system permease protein
LEAPGSFSQRWRRERSTWFQSTREPTLTDTEEILRQTRARGYDVSAPLGFNNTYGIGMRRVDAERRGIRRLSDLRGTPWRAAVSAEFQEAPTGLRGLMSAYGLSLGPTRVMEHALA